MVKAKTKKKKATRKVADNGKKPKGVKGLNGLGVCQNWIVCFSNRKEFKTAASVTAEMKRQYPGRVSTIFEYPNAVVGRANRGLLTGGKIPKPLFKKYATSDGKKKVAS